MVRASTFSPPGYAIWVNSLWLSSLAISLASALLATLLQQWTRRFIYLTQPLDSSEKRAWIHRVFNGVDDTYIQLAADAVPTLLHLSVLLFFGGLLILLREFSATVFNAVSVWVVLSVAVYAYVTILPISRPATTLYSPLSSLAWQFSAEILYVLSKLVYRIWRGRYNTDIRRPTRLLRRLEKKAEEIVSKQPLESNARILDSLLDTVGDDDALEKFLKATSDFYSSRMRFKRELSSDFTTKFRLSVNRFLDDTLSSDWISESTRIRRLLTCLDATYKVLGNLAGTSITYQIIRSGYWTEVSPSPEMGRILRRWRNRPDSPLAVVGSCIIARIIASVGEHDDTWMALTMSQLGVTKKVLESYLEHGDSAFLANLINTTRLFFKKSLQFRDILRSLSEFNIRYTLPGPQRDFCALWNEIVQDLQQSGASSDRVFILEEIRHVYIALHSTAPTTITTPSASADPHTSLLLEYPLCTDPSHLPTVAYTAPAHPPTAADTV